MMLRGDTSTHDVYAVSTLTTFNTTVIFHDWPATYRTGIFNWARILLYIPSHDDNQKHKRLFFYEPFLIFSV